MNAPRLDEVLGAIPPEARSLVQALREAAQRDGGDLYLVGGPVRDLLLGREIRDVDLVLEGGPGAEALARSAASRDTEVTTHDRFGTVTLAQGDCIIDIAGARVERYARPGALPRVEPGSLEADLRRRDFTINAMALSLAGAENAAAQIAEVEDGRGDLAAGRLRILHRRSFHDDPTRALRAARFSARFGFALTRGSRNSLRDAVRDGAFGAVSGERFRREFEKLFSESALGVDPAAALRRLADWDVLPALEPGLDLPRTAVAPLRRLGKAIASPPWRAARLRPLQAGLCVWLAPLAPALRRRVLGRLSVRGEWAQRIAGFPVDRDAWLRGLERARGRGAVDAALSGIDEERLLALWTFADPALRRRITRWAGEDRGRRVPVTGSDLVGIGLAGPGVGRALARIRAAFLDGGLANREEALALARELARERDRAGRRTRRR